ncbi:MAG: undecaprenyl/decaprenyl-phosphate alpha-N-acetylglucosaminyl 1-phosphate transferase [Oscillospiraceae bacterium]|jgi:UDP-GlcNAc:undecaprenyl-phosphate GlcNAc-1-phosphate transferase|nr:undecaprenyl/decaprenyl-phosphate alpha-N-acetylglucosaminyl 1-phosphate transferase [Oscillospiraceae bacterium]
MNETIGINTLVNVLVSLVAALVMSFAATPVVKIFAQKVGAMDVPRDGRRMHDHPIPRLGGLAMFMGFILSTLLFAKIDTQVRGLLLGCIVIVTTGVIDDIVPLKWWIKLLLQTAAALIAVFHGIRIEVLTNPVLFSENNWLTLGMLSVPITVIWIVGVTNSVNLIDGLDGLAVGVSAIGSATMLVIALLVSEANVAIILAALAGACVGFMPFNINPAKIFAGDTGALLLGYVLATMSVIGMFKVYAIISFIVPFLVLALPLFDTGFAIIRRLLRGQSPMHPDRGHVHHRLIDMGFSQKQAVAILYCVSAVFGLAAVVLASSGEMKALLLVLAFAAAGVLAGFVFKTGHRAPKTGDGENAAVGAPDSGKDDGRSS